MFGGPDFLCLNTAEAVLGASGAELLLNVSYAA